MKPGLSLAQILLLYIGITAGSALHAQSLIGDWSMFDGTVIMSFQPEGVLDFYVPEQLLTEEEKRETKTSWWKAENGILYFVTPGDQDTTISKYTAYADSIVFTNSHLEKIALYKADSSHHTFRKTQLDSLLTGNPGFLMNMDGDEYDVSFVNHIFSEDGEEYGTWTTFYFYGTLFLLIDYGELDVELYRVRSISDKNIKLSMGAMTGNNDNPNQVTITTLVPKH